MRRKVLSAIQSILIGLVILSGAIAAPVLFRPFFYWHIGPLHLTDIAGLTVEQIKTAYNEMMDFCIGLSDHFSAGVLPFSESGAEHFMDVRKLFLLDLCVLAVAGILLTALLIAFRGKKATLAGHTPGFWSAIGLAVSFSVVGGLAALDFDRAFTVFHKLFFPGKDNWLFDGRQDPIIHMLPAEFFRNCAIVIFGLILLSCAGLLLWDWQLRNKE